MTSLTTLLVVMKYMKSAAVKDIDIADILGQKYRYCINIGKGDIDPPLTRTVVGLLTVNQSWSKDW